jgi:dihydroneopterin aldolase
VSDTIEISGIVAWGRHGADPGEKDVPQRFDIDIALELDLSAARRSDALQDTLDYAAVHATVVRLVGERSFDLIERLGAELLDAVLADSRVQRASVRIAKPRRLAGATPAVTLHAVRR